MPRRKFMSEGLEFDLLLIGDGPDREELRKQIRRNGLASCAQITGFLQAAALNEALDRVHAVVMPPVCEETAGLAAIEHDARPARDCFVDRWLG
jgi:glycosyltransferase involved in cell wall biosynthesis